tara:strand:+ start:1253 stop:1489 length:237 start_codon:yes stop_codon:yes gene_type:complete
MEMIIEYIIIDDNELQALTISAGATGQLIVSINMAHRIQLALWRTLIPGITNSLRDKLAEITDGYLKEQLWSEQSDLI